MPRILVEGGSTLRGEVYISGAKNAALPLMASGLLTSDELVLENVPIIEDILVMAELLRYLGARVEVDSKAHRVVIQASEVTDHRVPPHLGRKMRASFLVTGPLLARTGHFRAPHPGGCAIGTRPVNVDIHGMQSMGARVGQDDDEYWAEATALRGTKIYLDYPSHTGTENLLMAACLAEGRTIIKHASTEPEVVNLAQCLTAMGARIMGAGTSVIEIEGVSRLHGAIHIVMPDRIEAGTFAIAGAIAGGEVRLVGVNPLDLDPLTYKLRQAGVEVAEGDASIVVRGTRNLRPVDVQALPFPGFPTDLQAEFAALMTQADGVSTIFERVYENRLGYANELRKLGANIEVISGQVARIRGPAQLYGTTVRALDIRCGAALVLAALAARGTTEILDAHHLDRGYEDMVGKLCSLGAIIRRVED
jgi:UDP-N-acetylglucosamine 1-carboxyvinyltransferase